MKIALIAAGQPRFTPDFITFMNQIKGFDRADFYFNFWTSTWVNSEDEARIKIEKIILPNYNLSKVKICNQPDYELPPHILNHPPGEPENIHWWYKRRLGMWQSLQMAFNLIDEEYDAIIKFRLDGRLFGDLDIRTVNLVDNELVFPDYAKAGFDDFKICDLFAVGTQQGMKFYCDLADHFQRLVPISDPNWEHNGHGTWSSEHILGSYMKENNKSQTLGDFKFHINWNGRSRFTDKHYHHGIVPDPTE
jgi:hypothetical protein